MIHQDYEQIFCEVAKFMDRAITAEKTEEYWSSLVNDAIQTSRICCHVKGGSQNEYFPFAQDLVRAVVKELYRANGIEHVYQYVHGRGG